LLCGCNDGELLILSLDGFPRQTLLPKNNGLGKIDIITPSPDGQFIFFTAQSDRHHRIGMFDRATGHHTVITTYENNQITSLCCLVDNDHYYLLHGFVDGSAWCTQLYKPYKLSLSELILIGCGTEQQSIEWEQAWKNIPLPAQLRMQQRWNQESQQP
jgi:hypothetical protein